MKFAKNLFVIFLCAVGLAASARSYQQHGNLITVQVKHKTPAGARLVRLQAINQDIIRVEATP